ncbi:hypothetical protein IMG5_197670 [Ichthyophthirius multifiliis]|uniref:Uncharacterized protein n=1 Tax=Ichthyophthirius multifiliis TaxID=5932 RepID=G0R5B9_ICHMU|nr:hypothetical protein IMG5_197670 [Ichthyophthirius multifiliis]EGR27332.1 hypothetical protein IMG5_197670 [Ichthyophthirius multifiliis]|eukprot:XP_004024216.1 hypothetical protein IMG5_197670 [Ichthyophthirius multifiliis]
MDCDNDGNISPQEFKNGLEGLKIFINQKDFVNFYSIIDKNMETKKIDLNLSFEDRFEKDEFEEIQLNLNPSEKFTSSQTEPNQNNQIKFSSDLTFVNGDLKIQIPFIQNIFENENQQHNFKEIYIRFILRGSDKPDFCKNIVLFEPKQVSGQIGVQIKWIPANSKEFTGGQIIEKDLFKQEKTTFTHSIVEKGILEFHIISAFLQQKQEKLKCQITLPLSKPESFDAKYDAQGNPFWSQKCTKELQAMTLKQIDSLSLLLYYEKGALIKEKYPIGNLYIDWQECLIYPGEYLTKKSYLFKQNSQIEKPSKVYIQLRWIPESLFQKLLGYKLGSTLKDKKKEIINRQEDLLEGILKIMLVRAKDLQGNVSKDSSDPYVKFFFENYDQEITIRSKTKKYTINPVWTQILQLNISYYKEGTIPPLKLEIWDQNALKDDSLGTSIIDITPSIQNPCTWAVDNYFDVEDPVLKNRENKPQIYIQTYFVPKGVTDPNIKPKDKDNLLQIRDENIIQGSLKIRIIHARELPGINRNNTSDPYVQMTLPGGQKEVKTSTISNTVNPQWNETFLEKILISKDRMAPLKIIVKNHDYLSQDDLLGIADVDWSKCVEEPGQWAVNNVFELQGGSKEVRSKSKQLGFLYVQIKFLEEYMIDDQTIPPLIENLAQMISEKQGLYKGTLRIFLVHGKNLVNSDGKNELNDSFVVFKVPGGKEVKSNIIKSLNPVWKQIYNIDIFMPKNTIQPMRVEVLDNDLFGKDLVGYCNIDLNELLNKPGVWAINQSFNLDADQNMRIKYKTDYFGEIYMQIMFVTTGLFNEDKPLPLNEDLDQKNREEKEKNKLVGVFEINVVMAQNLKAKDIISKSSDTYAEIIFPDKNKVQTKAIQKSLNPLWNQTFRHRINIIKEQYQPLKIRILNENTMAIDDILSYLELDWLDCFKNSTLWRINDIYQLQGEKKMGEDLGKIYIQCKFLNDSDLESPQANYICKTPEPLIPEYGRVLGNISVNIISGANLKNTDLIGKSDPYVKAYIEKDPSNFLKTIAIKDDLNPVWNFNGNIFLNLLRCQVKNEYVIFDVYDEDNVTDELIGQCKVHIVDLLENPDKDIQQDIIIQDIKKPQTNYGTLRILLKFTKSTFCEDLGGLRIPDTIINGHLFVKIVNGRQFKKTDLIGSCDPYVVFNIDLYPDKKYKSEPFKKNQNPDFNFLQQIPIEIQQKKSRQLSLQIKYYDDDLVGKSVLGGTTIHLSELFENQSLWFSQYYQLLDDKGNQTTQYSFIQINWRPENSKDTPDAPPVEDFQEFLKKIEPPKTQYQIFINLIGARKLKSSWTDIPDPFAEIKLSKATKTILTTKTIENNTFPIWNFCDKFTIQINEKELEILKMYITVIDYNYIKNDKIGSVEIALKPLFQTKNWFNQILPILDENSFPGAGEINVQILCKKEDEDLGSLETIPPMNLFENQKNEEEKKLQELKEKENIKNKEPTIKGELFFNIIESRNLLNLDTFDLSDPFVEVTFNFSKQTFKTPTINNNLNPQWNFTYKQLIEIRQSEMQKTTILFNIYDYDYNANDLLGYVEIEADNLFKNPGTWSNEIHQVSDAKGTRGKNGLFYPQIQWRPEGYKIDENLPIKHDISQFYKGVTPKGTVIIGVVSAKRSYIRSRRQRQIFRCLVNNLICWIKNIRTSKIQSLNPEWKQIIQFKVNFKDRSEMPFLYCSLVDWNFIGDTFLGDFECDISQILESPNQWGIQKEYALVNMKKQKIVNEPTGTVLLKIGFVEEGKDKEQGQWVLIVDKIDVLAQQQRQSVLYSLLDWLQNNKNQLTLVGITSDTEFQEKLEKRVKSRFQPDAFNCFFYDVQACIEIIQQRFNNIYNLFPENETTLELKDIFLDEKIQEYFKQNFQLQMKSIKYILSFLKTSLSLMNYEDFQMNQEIQNLDLYILELFEKAEIYHQKSREMVHAINCTQPELYVLICIQKLIQDNRHPINTITVLNEIRLTIIGVAPENQIKYPKINPSYIDPYEISNGHTHLFLLNDKDKNMQWTQESVFKMQLALKLAEGKISKKVGKPRCKIVNVFLGDNPYYLDEIRLAVKFDLPIIVVKGSDICDEIIANYNKEEKQYKFVNLEFEELLNKGHFYMLDSIDSEDIAQYIHFLLTFTPY